ncbi:hypothetical protein JCM3774_001950 [Rhodotorula dairenensis]
MADLDLEAFIRSIYPPHLFEPRSLASTPRRKPFVTLTWAQSIDGKISGKDKAQVAISGTESLRFTHRLRELHDSILVGVGTVLNDDPSLTARVPSLLPLESQPNPVILDPFLKTPPDAKLLVNARKGTGRPPTILTTRSVGELDRYELTRQADDGRANVIPVETEQASDRISLRALLDPDPDPNPNPKLDPPSKREEDRHRVLAETFGRSLMVEGGASVLASFLSPAPAPAPIAQATTTGGSALLVDLVVITVAPVLIGPEGLSIPYCPGENLPRLEPVATKVFGRETVFVCKPVWP